jgi:hypothetical protein
MFFIEYITENRIAHNITSYDKRNPQENPHRSSMTAMILKRPVIIMPCNSTHGNQQQEKTYTEMQAKKLTSLHSTSRFIT